MTLRTYLKSDYAAGTIGESDISVIQQTSFTTEFEILRMVSNGGEVDNE
jgi:hypothetical protein